MTTPTKFDTIVIGGGIIGASCAWHLLEAGVDNVLLLEKDTPASKASGRAAGHLSTYTSRKFEESIRRYCIEFHESIAARHDNVSLREDVDHVLAYTERGVEKLEELLKLDSEKLTLVDRCELANREPVFNTEEILAALLYEEAVHTDPYSLTMAVLSEAKESGATLRTEEVTDIECGEDEFTVTTEDASYETSTVVNAAGAWSGDLASMVGISLPVKPRTSQIVVLEPRDSINIPMFHCPDIGLYGRQELNGDVLVGGGTSTVIPDPDNFSTNAREEFLQYVSEQVWKIADVLDDTRLVNHWAGRCTATPDRRPIIGPTDVSGFYLCTGFNGGGVARSPFAGKLIADYVAERSLSFTAEPYHPNRFNGRERFDVKSASTDW
ncbi:NAD(P)/FAD-dependent oxidoreductase [Halalkalirubrum salinum]|uniref:NAD(P)/FAD-dependent oxidoreductase n=1 Tax=Halalkalirubrum salinum TaxID=2563889 RepID=UPI0010FAD46C|nr:FAD-binding oxidoreductase [Halalkalirubrum salinum]